MSWEARLRSVFGSIWFKATIAVLVLGLLFAFNRVDWRGLSQIGKTWPWLVLAFLLMLPPYVVVSYRFQLILASQGIDVPFIQAVRWTMIGSFFDLAMPSSNGGDLVKVGYVLNRVGQGLRTRAVMAVLIDRILGLLGLFLLASLVALVGWQVISTLPSRTPLLICLFGLSFGTLLGFRLLGARRLFNHLAVQKLFESGKWGGRARQLIAAFNVLREQPRYMFAALALSVCNHVFWCFALLCIARAVGDQVEWMKGFVVFPLAIFSNIFGVAGGFGVGTAAFDFLLTNLLAISNGALIGLLFQGLSAFSKLAGLPFYCSIERKAMTQPGLTRAR